MAEGKVAVTTAGGSGIIEHDKTQLRLSKAQLAEVENRLAGAADFATNEEVEVFFARLAG
jgi:hypothetical protein